MSDSDLKKVSFYPNYSTDSKRTTEEGFVNIDKGKMPGCHWTCFHIKTNKSFYFDSFAGAPDKFLFSQSPKPRIYLNCKIQHIKSRLCGGYCLYFFYLIEFIDYSDAILKLYSVT